jgi:predicted phosphodiesterase
MKILVVGDVHITESSIPEVTKIFQEIMGYDADVFVQLGDFVDKKQLTAKEQHFVAELTHQLNTKYKRVIFIVGNHPEIEPGISSMSWTHFVGKTEVIHDDVVKLCFDGKTCLFGHFFEDGAVDFDTETVSLKTLEPFHVALLGHFHVRKGHHLGSVRFCRFDEATEPKKYIAMIDTKELIPIPNQGNPPMIKYIELKFPTSMADITDIKKLDKIKPETKVRYTVNSFAEYKRIISALDAYKKKFIEFKIKKDFKDDIINVPTTTKKLNCTELLNNVADVEIREILSKYFKEEGLI